MMSTPMGSPGSTAVRMASTLESPDSPRLLAWSVAASPLSTYPSVTFPVAFCAMASAISREPASCRAGASAREGGGGSGTPPRSQGFAPEAAHLQDEHGRDVDKDEGEDEGQERRLERYRRLALVSAPLRAARQRRQRRERALRSEDVDGARAACRTVVARRMLEARRDVGNVRRRNGLGCRRRRAQDPEAVERLDRGQSLSRVGGVALARPLGPAAAPHAP